ncbi:MAG: hypothetical protein NVS9B14_12260 [Candidatus Acidiferrum sp.]
MLGRRQFGVGLFCFVLLFWAFQRVEAKKKPPLHPINLNTANSGQLQEVPGIGPATAEKILKMRKSYGPFKSVDDLRAIKGIGPKRLEKMRKYLTVGKPPAKSDSKAAAKNPPAASKPSP